MSDTVQFHSHVGDDGYLNLHINLGETEARKEVVVTVKTLGEQRTIEEYRTMPWHEFVERTYGSCAGLGLERPPQGEFEVREPIS
jgi:hypothetical protein